MREREEYGEAMLVKVERKKEDDMKGSVYRLMIKGRKRKTKEAIIARKHKNLMV